MRSMTSVRARRPALVVATLAVALAVVAGSGPSLAFDLPVHESIVRRAFTPPTGAGGVDAVALTQIIGSIFTDQGDLGSDRHQFDAFRHFDSAATPADVCTRAADAWAFFWPSILASAHPDYGTPAITGLLNGPAARSAFGGLAHSVQDFYSHSNWVELAVASGQSPSLAPIFPVCDPAALPAGLHTGYFRSTIFDPVAGCPNGGAGPPPAPFTDCHFGLNKDNLTHHGGDPVPGLPGVTFHALAVDLAVQATIALYASVRQQIEGSFTPQADDVSGSCIAASLFQATSPPSCLNITGSWSVTSSEDPTNVPIGKVFAFDQPDLANVTASYVSTACGPLSGPMIRSAAPTTFVGNIPECLEAPRGDCPPTISAPIIATYTGRRTLQVSLTLVDGDVTVGSGCPQTVAANVGFVLTRVP